MKHTQSRTAFERWSCPTQRAVAEIGDKWTLFVVREFIYGDRSQSFGDLYGRLAPISSRTLSLKLKKLQALGILERKVMQAQPLRVLYRITRKGLALKRSLDALAAWKRTFE